jgi:transposase-like protein
VLEPDDWTALVRATLKTLCPSCNSTNVTAGACAIGASTVHQEYVCESCEYEFTSLFVLAAFYPGHPHDGD